MNNNEIRLSLLCHFYKAKFRGNCFLLEDEDKEIGNIDEMVLEANLGYLVEKNLINGKKRYKDDDVLVITQDITAHGMDVVEKIMDQSLDKLDSSIKLEISKEEFPIKKFDKFYEKCIKSAPMWEVLIKVANGIFPSL